MTATSELSSGKDNPKLIVQLLVFSILALYCEMLVIRWLSTEIRIFAYFKNLPLTAAFLGQGLGFISARRKIDLLPMSTISFLFLSLLLSVALGLGLTFLTFADPLRFLLFGFAPDASQQITLMSTAKTVVIMLGTFVLTAACFVGLGQHMGRLFEKMPPLKAYSVNVLGGLIGTILFSVLSFAYATPGVWLIIAGAMFLYLRPRVTSALIIAFGIFYLVWFGSFMSKLTWGDDHVQTVWSPYYRVDLRKHRLDTGEMKDKVIGTEIYANYDGFQSILNTSPADLASYPPSFRATCLDFHSGPFRFVPPGPNSRLLILGSGAGMDVTAALRSKIANIDAVEIDPGIAQFGHKFEQPYDSPHVHLHVTDARTFLKNCKEKYDAVVFAYLDSHTAFSCLSSLRTDNYVFTQEAINAAVKLLKPDGYVAIGCVIMTEWLWDRHARALQAATGMPPLGIRDAMPSKSNTGILYAGPRMKLIGDQPDLTPAPPKSDVPVATDDWPFLFLEKRQLPTLYLWPILLIIAASIVPVSTQFATGARSAFNWQMFFMGAGFMLLEVRSLADMSLMFGSTWLINSVIIGGVMLMILLANAIAERLQQRHMPILALGILAGLVLLAAVPASSLTFLGPIAGTLLGTTICLVPMGFAAMLFALLFRDAEVPSQALAFNLIGGVLGVFLEYLSMLVGIRALSFIAMAIYAVPVILALRKAPAVAAPEPEPATN